MRVPVEDAGWLCERHEIKTALRIGGVRVPVSQTERATRLLEAWPLAPCPDAHSDCCDSVPDAQQELRAPVDGILLGVVRMLLARDFQDSR